jgi:hypothetical protein
MSYVIAAPEMMRAAATDLATIGSDLSAAHMAAASSTLALPPAGADEVSASIAQLFSRHTQDYQALAGRAAAFHEQFLQHVKASAGSYASGEAVNVTLLRPLTAIAGSVAGAGAGLQEQLGNLLTILGQLRDQLIAFIDRTPWLVALILAIEKVFYLCFLLFIAFVALVLYALGINPLSLL